MALGNKKTGTKAAGTKEVKKDMKKTNEIIKNVKVLRFTEFEKEVNNKVTMYGFVALDINGVFINGIKLMGTEEDGGVRYWLAFPQEKGKDGNYYNICGFTADISSDAIAGEVVAQINAE